MFVVPRGEIDLASVEPLARKIGELRDAGFAEVVLDLRRVTFMDSSGAHLIDELGRTTDPGPGGTTFGVVPGLEPVQRVLELCALDGVRYVDP